MAAGWLADMWLVLNPDHGGPCGTGFRTDGPRAGTFVQKHGPHRLREHVVRACGQTRSREIPFVQKHGPRWPMWYVFADKVARGQGRLSADTDHCRCRSMWYGCGDKRRRLEPLVCPQPRTTARRGACGTCLRTNPLVRKPVCPKTRTKVPHVVRVSGQMARGRNVCPKTRTKVPHVVRVPGQMACGRPVCPQTRTSMPETCHEDRPCVPVPKRDARTVPPSQSQIGAPLQGNQYPTADFPLDVAGIVSVQRMSCKAMVKSGVLVA